MLNNFISDQMGMIAAATLPPPPRFTLFHLPHLAVLISLRVSMKCMFVRVNIAYRQQIAAHGFVSDRRISDSSLSSQLRLENTVIRLVI